MAGDHVLDQMQDGDELLAALVAFPVLRGLLGSGVEFVDRVKALLQDFVEYGHVVDLSLTMLCRSLFLDHSSLRIKFLQFLSLNLHSFRRLNQKHCHSSLDR